MCVSGLEKPVLVGHRVLIPMLTVRATYRQRPVGILGPNLAAPPIPCLPNIVHGQVLVFSASGLVQQPPSQSSVFQSVGNS